jgi:glutaredoxin
MTVTLYTASWCQPCKAVQAILERFAASMGFLLELRDVAFFTDQAAEAQVRTVPTILVGNRRIVGRMSEASLRAVLEEEIARSGSAGSSGPGNSSSP